MNTIIMIIMNTAINIIIIITNTIMIKNNEIPAGKGAAGPLTSVFKGNNEHPHASGTPSSLCLL